MRRLYILLGYLLLISNSVAAINSESVSYSIVGTEKITSILHVNKEKIETTGRVSFHLTTTQELLKKGQFEIKGFNIIHFDIKQQNLTGSKSEGKATGAVGFNSFPVKQLAHYDESSNKIHGELKGHVSFPQLVEIANKLNTNKKSRSSPIPQNASLYFEIQLSDEFMPQVIDGDVAKIKSALNFDLQVMQLEDYNIIAYDLRNIKPEIMSLEAANRLDFRVVNKLCLQPVRFSWLTINRFLPQRKTRHYTGKGLEFGLPQAHEQWSKAGVVFNVRDWVTAGYLNPDDRFDNITTLTDANLYIPSSYQADDCLEIFFVHEFEVRDMWGGGFSSAAQFIVTTDILEEIGLDKTHLAHELGHIQALAHPDEDPNVATSLGASLASTGTLMCISGYARDNPQINSQENADLIQHPLYTFSIVRNVNLSEVDCLDSQDCGECP